MASRRRPEFSRHRRADESGSRRRIKTDGDDDRVLSASVRRRRGRRRRARIGNHAARGRYGKGRAADPIDIRRSLFVGTTTDLGAAATRSARHRFDGEFSFGGAGGDYVLVAVDCPDADGRHDDDRPGVRSVGDVRRRSGLG